MKTDLLTMMLCGEIHRGKSARKRARLIRKCCQSLCNRGVTPRIAKICKLTYEQNDDIAVNKMMDNMIAANKPRK